jgi:intermembrane space import and assembly protein 40
VFKSYSTRSGLALGATVTFAAYMAWSLSSDSQRISLDAHPVPSSKKLPVSTTPSLPAADSPPPPIQTEETSSETSVPVIEEDTDKTPHAAPVENPSEEQPSGGAYNPVTGEINWDCPCLGGMAHGPCGPEFREAFSCFVYSEKEPKGIDCVEKFKAMQTCFREHPDVYGDEIMDDDDDESQGEATPSDVKISEAEYTTLDKVQEPAQPRHPSSPVSAS